MEPVVGAPLALARGPIDLAPIHKGGAGVEDAPPRVVVGHLVGIPQVHHWHTGVEVEEGEA
eukprot:10681053-Lingulodinium_polyedra.AAC.1